METICHQTNYKSINLSKKPLRAIYRKTRQTRNQIQSQINKSCQYFHSDIKIKKSGLNNIDVIVLKRLMTINVLHETFYN